VSGVEKRIVYILRSDRNPERHYTGVTTDIVQRLRWHNAGQNTDTARDRPWSVVVTIEFNTEQSAFEFERYLKSGSGRAFAKRHFT
jgi:putative endonuclease